MKNGDHFACEFTTCIYNMYLYLFICFAFYYLYLY